MSSPGILTAPSERRKNTQGGLVGLNVAFITHRGRVGKQDCLPLCLRLVLRGPRWRRHIPYLWLWTTLPQRKEKVKKQSQDRKPLPKGDEEVASLFQKKTIPSGQRPSDQPSVMGGGGPCIDPTWEIRWFVLVFGICDVFNALHLIKKRSVSIV